MAAAEDQNVSVQNQLCAPLQLPLPEEIHWTPGDSKLHDMSAEEVANQLVVFDWELFSCVHEVSDLKFLSLPVKTVKNRFCKAASVIT